MNGCSFFGIYPYTIEKVNDICHTVLCNAGFNIDEIDEIYGRIKEDINRSINPCDEITDTIIQEMFDNTKYELERKFDGLKVEYTVNGFLSSMMINNEYAENFDFCEVKDETLA